MNDLFKVSGDVFFTAALLCVYGSDALTRIEIDLIDRRIVNFYLSVPSLDASEYFKEFKEGKLGVTDLMAYTRHYSSITRRLKDMRFDRQDSWCSSSWISG